MQTLTAIIPATDRPSTLARCLEALRAAEEGPDETIVVEEPAGSGPAAARNRGAEQAVGDILVFVDADVEVHEDAIRRIRQRFGEDERLTALFGSYDDAPAATGVVSGFRNLLHHHVHQSSPGPAVTFWSGLGAVRREAFLAAGGFDAERFPLPSIEDIELGMRLSAAGARIALDPSVQGTHLKRWAFSSMVATDFSQRGVPWMLLLLETGRPSAALNLGWRHRASAVASLAGLLAVAGRRPRAVAASTAALVALNRSFYALLLRRRGPAEAALGVGLHAIHHLTGVAAAVAAVGLSVTRAGPGKRLPLRRRSRGAGGGADRGHGPRGRA